ncbi:hypothetical protein [Pseudoalteromonas sp. NJ631]|uniref:hypothetical protein n=1 Tax=Pseudoalteromonas sp. NJ631 TaxID=493915 RepID=UPI0002F562FA|nr:hypothetical protein [Pseudoalteromonas sp. NJ631]
MKLSSYFFLIAILIAVSLSYFYIALNNYANFIMLAVIVIFSSFSKQLVNLKHISVVLFIFTLIELSAVELALGMRKEGLEAHLANFSIFGVYFLLDLTALLLLKHRVRLSLRYMRFTNPDNWRSIYMTYADPILYGIFFAFVLVDLAAFGENLIRYMDLFFGVSEEASKPFWSWSWVYKNYEILKSILLSCVITTLLATIFVERQRPDTPDEELESEPK